MIIFYFFLLFCYLYHLYFSFPLFLSALDDLSLPDSIFCIANTDLVSSANNSLPRSVTVLDLSKASCNSSFDFLFDFVVYPCFIKTSSSSWISLLGSDEDPSLSESEFPELEQLSELLLEDSLF